MKQIKLFATGVLLLSIIGIACRKQDQLFVATEKSESLIPKDNLRNNKAANTNQNQAVLSDLETLTNINFSNFTTPSTEYEASILLADLQNNSILKLKSELNFNDPELIDVFGSLSNSDIGYFYFVLTVLDEVDLTPQSQSIEFCNPSNKIARCAINALLPCDLLVALRNFTGGSINGAAIRVVLQHSSPLVRKQLVDMIVKTVGRSVGYLYVAYAIADFTMCMVYTDDVPTTPEGLSAADLNTSYLLPLTFPSSINYFTGVSEIYANDSSTLVLYFNSADNKYYTESSFTNLAPDGYYLVQNNAIFGDLYYEILGGESLMAYTKL